jgi:peptide/nickel transport system ATP-binding protein
MLSQVGLTPPSRYFGRYPHQLSGGQRQRVVIAMALALRPRLLILDEPTTGLDATVQASILDLLTELRGQFIDALLFITHNLDLVRRTCDRVSVLYAGRVVESGTVSSVLARPAHPYTAALLACVPRADDRAASIRLPAIPGSPPRTADSLPGCTFAPRCALATPECEAGEPPLRWYRDKSVPSGRIAPGSLSDDWLVRCIRPGEPVRGIPLPGSAAPPSTEVLLDVRGLTKRYGDVVGCDGVDLVVHRNETLGLVGESGSGKTTVARAIAGLTPRESGEMRWHGSPLPARVARRPRDVARGLQLVPQHPDTTLNPRRRVGAILARAVKRLGGDLPVSELAAAVRLDQHHLASRANELSGGQRQRAAIARAFAGHPELVICDEPVSSLDVSVQAVIVNLLADLQAERGTSYLFISHDLAVVRYLAHTVAVIYGGRIVETGPADQVFAGPRHPYTEMLLDAAFRPEPDDTASFPTVAEPAAAGPPLPPGSGATACVFASRCPVRIGPVCDTEPPPWQEPQSGHRIRCHHDALTLSASQGARPGSEGTVLVAPGDG